MTEFRLAATLHEEGQPASAIGHLRRSLDLDADNARAHILMGYIHMERENFPEAEPSLRRGIELLRAQEGDGATLAEATNMLGATLIHLDRHDEAIELLRTSATDLLNRAPHLAWGNLGLAYLEKQRYDEALEALGQSVRVQPRFCRGYYLIGRVHHAREEFEQAEEALNRAIEADPLCESYQEAFQLRGEVRARLEHREDAIADYERCVEINRETATGQACARFLEGIR